MLVPIAALAYTLWHIWWLPPIPPAWRTALTVLCALAFLLLFPSMTPAIDRLPMPLATAAYVTGTSSLIALFYCALAFLALDLLRLLRLLPSASLRLNAPIAVGLTLAVAALLLYGNFHYHRKARRTLSLTTAKPISVPDGGLTIVMASDLHIGYHIRRKELAQWVDMINAERPDLVLFAGDLVDRSMRPILCQDMAAEFRRLQAPAYACPGNHEYYCGMAAVQAFCSQAGITLLRDSVARLPQGIAVAGRDDRTNTRRKSLQALLDGRVDKGDYLIVLDHQPLQLDSAARAHADFQLSGHTHHGQVFPASLLTQAIFPIAHGEGSLQGTRFYVSSGLGIWGGKFRIGTSSEYVVATLRRTPQEGGL